MQVQVLNNPSTDEFRQVLQSLEPNIVYFQGEQIEDREEIGSLRWADADLSTPESLCGLFGSTLPPTVSDGQQDIIFLVLLHNVSDMNSTVDFSIPVRYNCAACNINHNIFLNLPSNGFTGLFRDPKW